MQKSATMSPPHLLHLDLWETGEETVCPCSRPALTADAVAMATSISTDLLFNVCINYVQCITQRVQCVKRYDIITLTNIGH